VSDRGAAPAMSTTSPEPERERQPAMERVELGESWRDESEERMRSPTMERDDPAPTVREEP